MAIEIREKFQVAAPAERVWRFVLDPNKIVLCIPGASLDEVVDERTFLGNVKVKVGAITTGYKGRIELTAVDDAAYRVEMSAEGTEASGGTAKGTMTSYLTTLPDGGTEMVVEASIDLTGRIMQVGRGMIQGVSKQLFQQFVRRVRATLEAPVEEGSTEETAQVVVPKGEESLAVIPLLLKTLWAAIVNFFKRLFNRG